MIQNKKMTFSRRFVIGATSTITLGVVLYNLYSYYFKRNVEQKSKKQIPLSINKEKELLWKKNTPCLPSQGPIFLFGPYKHLNNNAFIQASHEDRKILMGGSSISIEKFLKNGGPDDQSCVIITPELANYFGQVRCGTFDKLIHHPYTRSWLPFMNSSILECNVNSIAQCKRVTIIVTKEMLSNYETELLWMIVKDWIANQIAEDVKNNEHEKQVVSRIVFEELLNAVGTLEESDGNRPWAAIFSHKFSFLYPMDDYMECNDAEVDPNELNSNEFEENEIIENEAIENEAIANEPFEHIENPTKPFEGEIL